MCAPPIVGSPSLQGAGIPRPYKRYRDPLLDQALMAAALGTAGGETRVKSWNAPKKGEYTFRCSIPGHASRGEVGKMIVQ